MRTLPRVSRRATVVVVAALALAALPAPAAPAKLGPPASSGVRVVASFDAGQFPEGLAVDLLGRRYVSVTTWGLTENDPGTGQVVRVSRGGGKTPFGPQFDVGLGLLTGVEVDQEGTVYVGNASFEAASPPGVWRITRFGSAKQVLTLPDDSFPNGLALRGGDLFVSDSIAGAIWRLRPKGGSSVWFQSPLLAPDESFGANGIAFWRGSLYVAVSDAGRIVRVPLRHDGSAGAPAVVAERPELQGADGIAFDIRGNLYVATSSTNTLVRLAPNGQLTQLADESDGLRYPTTPAFGGLLGAPTTLNVVNGDLFGTEPNLVALDVGHVGVPLH